LLHDAIVEATAENLDKLKTVWQGQALSTARAFARQLYGQYAKPLQVQFEYLAPLAIEGQLPGHRIVVTSQERWSYGGPTKTDYQEAFKFVYTLSQKEGKWLITEYTFFNLPLPKATLRPTIIPTRPTTNGG
jgi:hypothetical protein